MEQAARSQEKGKKKKKQNDPTVKMEKILSYLFLKDGLAEKNILQHEDGFVNANDILDIYSDYTEDHLFEVTSSGDFFMIRQCPQTGQLQIRRLTEGPEESQFSQDPHLCTNPTDIQGNQTGRRERSGKGRREGRPEGKHDVHLSKFLSWLLRHGAEKEGLKMQEGGFLYVDDILKLPKMKGRTVEDVQRVVLENDKQRFFMERHSENGQLKIRANQGHTMKVLGLELHPIRTPDQFPTVVHGTFLHCWPSILKQGLSRMRRTHIHFAPGEPGESGVISGMRGSCEVLIYIDLNKALSDGLEFFASSNNVILSPGDQDGFLKARYFASVWQRNPKASTISTAETEDTVLLV